MSGSVRNFTAGIVLTSCLITGAVVSTGVQASTGSVLGQLFSSPVADSLTVRSLSAEADHVAELQVYRATVLNSFVASLDEAVAHVADVTVTNDVLAGLRAQVGAEVTVQKSLVVNSVDGGVRFPGVMLTAVDMEAYVSEHYAVVSGLVASYDAELSAENNRIAEAAAAEAARAAQTGSYVQRGNESQEARVQRIAAEVGITVPVIIQEGCGGIANVLGCFTLPDNYINITQFGLSRGDADLRCTLIHEARHAWQYATGFLNYLPGETEPEWRNRAETDARANGCG